MSDSYLGENLIFVISQPRSGSTLLQRILFGHPDVQTSAETWLMLHPVYGLRKTGFSAEYGSQFACEGVEEFLENYTHGHEVYLDAIREWARTIYQDAIQKHQKRYFLDKTPRYFFIIPELFKLFPKAKFVFLLRNPMAVLASELSTYVKGDWPVLGIFNADLISAPGWILDGIELLGERGYSIHYERFVSDPENAIRALCDYLELDFHEHMLDYSGTPKPLGRYNDPTGINQHTRASTGSVEKWKDMVNDDQSLHFAQRYLAGLGEDTIRKLGYDYQELFNTLHSRTVSPNRLYPWSIAIQPESLWTFRQQFTSDLYFNRKACGQFKGTLATLKTHLLNVLRVIRRELSSPDDT
ncbi:MAG: sulfotransferase [Thiogranum sp.]